MIAIVCPSCSRGIEAADDRAGKQIPCNHCGAPIQVPVSTDASEAATLAPAAMALPLTTEYVPPAEAPNLNPNDAPLGKPSFAAAAVAIPGYEILGELGRGGMGVVYRALQMSPRRLVALKMILAGEYAGSDTLARFKVETESAAQLSHPGIVRVHEVGEHQGRAYLTLEYVEGGNLAQKIAGKPLKFRETALLLYQLAQAVHFAHEQGIIHRDLKPANILLSPDEEAGSDAFGTPKIVDFGLAKQIEGMANLAVAGPRTQTGAILGTPGYMAPEQAGGKSKDIGPAVDVYALGAILYECLTGRPPFQVETTFDTLLKVVGEEPVSPRQRNRKCPRDLETICLKYLEKDPKRRYVSAQTLADDLQRYLDDKPIASRSPGRLERFGRRLRKRRELFYLAAGVVIAVFFSFLLPARLNRGKGPKMWTEQETASADRLPDDLDLVPQDAFRFFTIRADVSSRGDLGDLDDFFSLRPLMHRWTKAGIELDDIERVTAACLNDLTRIGQAMRSYHRKHNCLPPAAFYGKGNKPLYSWRVLLLPHLGQQALYDQFHLDETWDSEHNKKLLAKMPAVYTAPWTDNDKNMIGRTYYQVFVGPGAVFEGKQGRRLTDIIDGTSFTLLAAEAAEAVPWASPRDLVYDPWNPLPRLGGNLQGGFNVLMANGSARWIRQTINELTLRAAITRQGRERLGPDW